MDNIQFQIKGNRYHKPLNLFAGFMKILLVVSVLVISSCNSQGPTEQAERTVQNFNFNWKFIKGEVPNAQDVKFKDVLWQDIDPPPRLVHRGAF